MQTILNRNSSANLLQAPPPAIEISKTTFGIATPSLVQWNNNNNNMEASRNATMMSATPPTLLTPVMNTGYPVSPLMQVDSSASTPTTGFSSQQAQPYLLSMQSVPASFGMPSFYTQQSYPNNGWDVPTPNNNSFKNEVDFPLRSTLSLPISPAMQQTSPITSPLMLRGVTSPVPSSPHMGASLNTTRSKTIAKHSNATSACRAYACEFDNCTRSYSTPQARRQHYRRRHQEAWASRRRKCGRQQSIEYATQSSHEGDHLEHRSSTDSGKVNLSSAGNSNSSPPLATEVITSPTLEFVGHPPVTQLSATTSPMVYDTQDVKPYVVNHMMQQLPSPVYPQNVFSVSDAELMQLLLERMDTQQQQQHQRPLTTLQHQQQQQQQSFDNIMSGSAYEDIQNIEQFIRC